MRDCQYLNTDDCGAANAVARPIPQREEETRIKCRSFGALTIPAETAEGAAFPLVNMDVDAHEYKKPCVKVEFISNILTEAATGTLRFQLFRQCNGQLSPIPVGAGWTYSRAVATADEANAFGFTLCDCDNCNCGCCNYSVVATVVGGATTGTITINNATLITTVVEGAEC